MANTYVAIATVTVGSGGANSIEFTSIPGTYTDLVLKVSGRSNTSTAQGIFFSLNGSTSSRSTRDISGDGSSASSGSATDGYTGGTILGTGATASTFGNTEFYFPNYAGSTNKSFSLDTVAETNATTAYVNLAAGLWSNTAAITSIKLTIGSTAAHDFVQYSTATLYGIKNS
jgi:hypothetical protein